MAALWLRTDVASTYSKHLKNYETKSSLNLLHFLVSLYISRGPPLCRISVDHEAVVIEEHPHTR